MKFIVQCVGLGVVMLQAAASASLAGKVSECTKIDICYCVNSAAKSEIERNVAAFRAEIARQREAGKAIGYISVPLSPAGGGAFAVNSEVAASVRQALEKRYGADQVWLLNPAVPEANITGGTGADYMLMWTTILEGTDGMGAIDFAYFVGPSDFGHFFGFDGQSDMAKLEQYFDKRLAADTNFRKVVDKGLTRTAFRNYYALKAAANISRGAHDEWNIVKALNERRRANEKFGLANQITPLFDGHGMSPADFEGVTSQGYASRCSG